MPLGMSRSAPASACTTAISASRASVPATSAFPSVNRTHWPWVVYAQTQTSVATARSGAASFTAWIARVTTWSRSDASIARSSLRSDMPKINSPAMPADAAARASRTSSVIDRRSSQGASSTRSRSSTRAETMTGWTSRPVSEGAARARDQRIWSARRPRISVAWRTAPDGTSRGFRTTPRRASLSGG